MHTTTVSPTLQQSAKCKAPSTTQHSTVWHYATRAAIQHTTTQYSPYAMSCSLCRAHVLYFLFHTSQSLSETLLPGIFGPECLHSAYTNMCLSNSLSACMIVSARPTCPPTKMSLPSATLIRCVHTYRTPQHVLDLLGLFLFFLLYYFCRCA